MAGKRAFVSFDYDHDVDCKNALIAQSRVTDSPFEVLDWSIKEPSSGWQAEARSRIRACHVVVVLCGAHTNTAQGVATELDIARDEGVEYFLLGAYSTTACVKPMSARSTDTIYEWTWANLKKLIGGSR